MDASPSLTLRAPTEEPPTAWATAVAAVGALLCCQVLVYEMVLLGLVVPHVLDSAAAGRRGLVLIFLPLFGLASVPFEVIAVLGEGGRFGAWEGAVTSHRSLAVALLAGTLLVGGWPSRRMTNDPPMTHQ